MIELILKVAVTPPLENLSSSGNAYVEFFGRTATEPRISRFPTNENNISSDLFDCADIPFNGRIIDYLTRLCFGVFVNVLDPKFENGVRILK